MNEYEPKRIKHVQDLEKISCQIRGQKAYVDGLFLAFQAQTHKEHAPRTHHELHSLSVAAMNLAGEIDTLLCMDERLQAGAR